METPFSTARPSSPGLDRWHRHVAVSSINMLLPPVPQDPPLLLHVTLKQKVYRSATHLSTPLCSQGCTPVTLRSQASLVPCPSRRLVTDPPSPEPHRIVLNFPEMSHAFYGFFGLLYVVPSCW